MPDHSFHPALAREYGTDAAIFLQNIWFWVRHNRAHEQNFHEGRYWTYNSVTAFCKVHPYWSRRQIERIIGRCRREGLLLSGCFNQDRRDRTCWYTLSDKALALLEGGPQTEACGSQNSEAHTAGPGNPGRETVEPLPDEKPDGKPDKKQERGQALGPETADGRERSPAAGQEAAPMSSDALFGGFWAAYPRKRGKESARRAWRKLAPDLALCRVMAEALERQRRSEDWRREGGQFIPYPATWLSGRRWEDEPDGAAGPEEAGEGVTYI